MNRASFNERFLKITIPLKTTKAYATRGSPKPTREGELKVKNILAGKKRELGKMSLHEVQVWIWCIKGCSITVWNRKIVMILNSSMNMKHSLLHCFCFNLSSILDKSFSYWQHQIQTLYEVLSSKMRARFFL